jgi:6,7-dimethyl-8-ribityllumazine synthase
MVKRDPQAEKQAALPSPVDAVGARILVIQSCYYDAIARSLREGALAEIEASGASHEVVTVAGALEIPQALAQAVALGRFGGAKDGFAGAVALGCVIRGETAHYDIVCNNANHWLMEIAIRHVIPLGNAILTVDSEAQAIERAHGGRAGKGGEAARACLGLVALRPTFAGVRS